jgi:hypothetical protein
MLNSIAEIMALLDEIAGHLKANSAPERRAARKKLGRVVALSSTLALMLEVKH